MHPAEHPAVGGRRQRDLLRSVLGEALRRARLDQGRTLSDVALSASISMPYLSEVERGLKEVSSEVLAALCAALGIELADLLITVVIRLTSQPELAPARTAAPPARRPGDAYALAA
jgi:transcriptional regulator with XRE-family HTH domain